MRSWLIALAVWIVILAALALLFYFVPSANSVPEWVYVVGVLAIVASLGLVGKRKRTRS